MEKIKKVLLGQKRFDNCFVIEWTQHFKQPPCENKLNVEFFVPFHVQVVFGQF